MGDSAFWQATTLALPIGMAAAVAVFAFIARLADAAYPSFDASMHVVFMAVVILMVAAAAVLALRRTPRAIGAATGVATAGLLVAFVWVATI
ncbi:hypothetical protein ACFYO1_27310 [Nocardia sp. NPDC006044]|uniref:hypothetical protein n=1 Tax=Nocardia sp. NPDC006044 TaxID=3364306 RepID=UPI0036B5F222